MRVLLLAAAFLAVPASAQVRITPSSGALVVTGGTAGEAVRVRTLGQGPADRQRLSQRYRGITVNRSPQSAAGGAAPRAIMGTAGGFNVLEPTINTTSGTFIRRNNSAFRVRPGR